MFRQRSDQDFYDEIEAHLQLETDQLIEEGMDPQEAAYAARRAFGNLTRTQERFYESSRLLWLDHLLRNVRYACRQMRRAPVSTAAILLSLGLGVGLNTSIFSLADQALFRPLPVRHPESLVQLQWEGTFVVAGMGNTQTGHIIPFPLYRQLRQETDVFAQVFARTSGAVHLGLRDVTLPAQAELVTGSFFSSLGIRPVLGRLLDPSDDRTPDGHPQVVLSHAFWQNQLGGDPEVVGEQIRVNDYPMTIVGVAEAGFHGMDWSLAPAIWMPMLMKERVTVGWRGFDEHRSRFAHVYARLPRGTTRQAAELQLEPWFRRYLEADVQRPDWPSVNAEQHAGYLAANLRVLPGGQGQARMARQIERPMLILAGATGLVLLLACLNVANLSLARAFAARRATALRTALGASRRRILGESFIESGVLALLGGALGALAAPLVSRFVLTLLLDGTESGGVALHPGLDMRVLLFALAATACVTLLAGAAPAVFMASMQPIAALQQRMTGGTGALGLRKALVVGQFALALVLLIGAGLFARTLSTLRGAGPGYSTSNLLMFQIAPNRDGYDRDQTRALASRIEERLWQLPDVDQVGIAAWAMLRGGGWNNPVTIGIDGRRVPTSRSLPMNAVSPGFFDTLGVNVLMGRGFRASDRSDEWNLRSVIVNRELVDRYLDGQNPVGARLAFGRAPDVDPQIEIIGVVESFQDYGLRQPEPQVYFALWERPFGSATFYVRASASSEHAAEAIRRTLSEIDPTLTILSLRTLDDQLDRLLTSERVLATLAGAFALVATLLAMIGLYGVLAFSAERRMKEIGIRMALGAPRWSAGGLILREAAGLVAGGLGLALPVIWAFGRLIESQLFGVHSTDLATLAAATATLLAISLLASALPARKAGRMHPLDALRTD